MEDIKEKTADYEDMTKMFIGCDKLEPLPKTADEIEVKKCHWCKKGLYEKDIQELSNARGYGYYIICPNCKNKNVIQEIDLTREF